MHRATPSDSSFRGYGAGGRVGVVSKVSDSNGIQTCSSGMMKNESRDDVEAPQNYGFTSVCADADKNGQGPESTINYMGGNGSFPICSSMDDRRHRLKSLDKDAAKGSSAMFGMKEWGQQLLNTETGWFMTGNKEKKLRLQLVENDKQEQQGGGQGGGGGGASVSALAEGGDGGGGGGGEGGGAEGDDSKMGQKSLHKKETDIFVDVDKNRHHIRHKNCNMWLDDQKSIGYYMGGGGATTFASQEPKTSFQADSGHAHIKCGNNSIFVDDQGCWSSRPIEIKSDNCSSSVDGGGGSSGGGTQPPQQNVNSASPPLQTANGNVSLNYSSPLGMTSVAELGVGIEPTIVESLTLKFAAPLTLDGSGQLMIVPGTYAPLNSPAFIGTPTAPTPSAGDNDNSIATTAYVQNALALGNGTGGAPLDSPVFTGDPRAPTPTFGDNDTSIATTAFVQSAVAGGGSGVVVALTTFATRAVVAATDFSALAIGTLIRTLAYGSTSNGGGAFYEKISGTVGAGAGWITTVDGSKFRLYPEMGRINIKQFGALHDAAANGTVDSTTAITDCINFAIAANDVTTIVFGAGEVYTITAALPIITRPIEIVNVVGLSASPSILNKRYSETSPTRGILHFTNYSPIIRGINIVATLGSGGSAIAIVLGVGESSAGRTTLADLNISTSDHTNYNLYIDGVNSADGARNIYIDNCQFFGTAITCVKLHSVRNVSMHGITCVSSGGTSGKLEITGTAGVISDNVMMSNMVASEITLDYANRIHFSGSSSNLVMDHTTQVYFFGRLAGNINNTANCTDSHFYAEVLGTIETDWGITNRNCVIDIAQGVIREKLNSNRTYYVRTDGNDSNTGGENTSASAWLTLQRAYEVIRLFDFNGYHIIINVGAGTYTAGVVITSSWIGGGSLTYRGDTTTPANVTLNVGAGIAFNINGLSAPVLIEGFKFTGTTSTPINVADATVYLSGKVEFGSGLATHIIANPGALFNIDTDYTITGGGGYHIECNGGRVNHYGTHTVTLTGTPAFAAAFILVRDQGNASVQTVTYSGAATGKRYQAIRLGNLFTNGAGANYFPGNVAGEVLTGGQYN
jgi:hypothetical protein